MVYGAPGTHGREECLGGKIGGNAQAVPAKTYNVEPVLFQGMASNLISMSSNLLAMASNLEAMPSNLLTYLLAMARLQPKSRDLLLLAVHFFSP